MIFDSTFFVVLHRELQRGADGPAQQFLAEHPQEVPGMSELTAFSLFPFLRASQQMIDEGKEDEIACLGMTAEELIREELRRSLNPEAFAVLYPNAN